jgi:hypothetical protein
MNPPLSKTQIVWWRFGKEHGEEKGIRLNSPDLISAALNQRAAIFAAVPDESWRWYQVDEKLLVERPQPSAHYGSDTRIYYLLKDGLTVVENIYLPPPRDKWTWYIHIGDTFYDRSRELWIQRDLFVDVVIEEELRHHRLLDLHDVATALDIGLIGAQDVSMILRRTNKLLQAIGEGRFPLPEIERARAACRALGW